MSQLALYGTGIAFSFIAWGMVTAWYVWPELRRRSRAEALRPLLLLHCFRFVGLSFLVPGVVSPDLPVQFAGPAAYGDLIAAVLALLALAAGLQTRLGLALAWVFNLGAPPTFSTPSIRAIRLVSNRVNWGPPTSL
jgi:hypothetical protein